MINIMMISYIDKSQRSGCYMIGAAVTDQATWEIAEDRLDALRHEVAEMFSLPHDIEFHGHPLMQGKQDWSPMKGRHRENGEIYLKALSVFDDLAVSFIFHGIDIARQRARYKNPWPPHSVCMTFALESLNDFARSRNGEAVTVKCDETSYEHELSRRFENDRRYGTFGYRHSRLEHITSPLNFCSSADTSALQIIDLALYVWQRSAWPLADEHPKARGLRKKLVNKFESRIFRAEIWRP